MKPPKPTPQFIKDNILTKWDCINNGGVWSNYNSNFDNIGRAMLTLFELMMAENWMEIMYLGVDSKGIDL